MPAHFLSPVEYHIDPMPLVSGAEASQKQAFPVERHVKSVPDCTEECAMLFKEQFRFACLKCGLGLNGHYHECAPLPVKQLPPVAGPMHIHPPVCRNLPFPSTWGELLHIDLI